MATKEASVIVVMVPLPIHSHMNHLLQLSLVIPSYNILVHYAGSSLHNSQVRTRADQGLVCPLELSKIQFYAFLIPPFVSSSNSSKLAPALHVIEHLPQAVSALLHDLSAKAERSIVIHDGLVSSVVQDV